MSSRLHNPNTDRYGTENTASNVMRQAAADSMAQGSLNSVFLDQCGTFLQAE